jgi:cytochrome c
MRNLKQTLALAAVAVMVACGGGEPQTPSDPPATKTEEVAASPKGIGEIKHVDIEDAINEAMAEKGKSIYNMKCSACHLTTDKRVVGPGFSGVTNRRAPEWIMNMITNVEVMLDEDPVAQKLLEECLTRMPNQNVSVGDARDILEFFRQNDLATAGSKDGAIVK